jgi:hypothetical protein
MAAVVATTTVTNWNGHNQQVSIISGEIVSWRNAGIYDAAIIRPIPTPLPLPLPSLSPLLSSSPVEGIIRHDDLKEVILMHHLIKKRHQTLCPPTSRLTFTCLIVPRIIKMGQRYLASYIPPEPTAFPYQFVDATTDIETVEYHAIDFRLDRCARDNKAVRHIIWYGPECMSIQESSNAICCSLPKFIQMRAMIKRVVHQREIMLRTCRNTVEAAAMVNAIQTIKEKHPDSKLMMNVALHQAHKASIELKRERQRDEQDERDYRGRWCDYDNKDNLLSDDEYQLHHEVLRISRMYAGAIIVLSHVLPRRKFRCNDLCGSSCWFFAPLWLMITTAVSRISYDFLTPKRRFGVIYSRRSCRGRHHTHCHRRTLHSVC